MSVPVGVILSAALIWQSTYAAFNATSSNTGNSFSIGSVALSDDDSSTAQFTATNLKPGSTGTHCIAVTSTGSLASTVKLYGASYSTTNGLGTNINLSVTQGNGGSFSSCAGFTPLGTGSSVYSGTLDSFATTSTNFASGLGTWAPTGTGSETRTFQFVYTVSASAPNSVQGGTATIAFTWEAQNS